MKDAQPSRKLNKGKSCVPKKEPHGKKHLEVLEEGLFFISKEKKREIPSSVPRGVLDKKDGIDLERISHLKLSKGCGRHRESRGREGKKAFRGKGILHSGSKGGGT